MSRAAIAFKPRTGKAILITLAGNFGDVKVLERSEVPLLPQGEFAPYHAAEGLEPEAARRYVTESRARAQRLAITAVSEAARRCAASGHELCGCAVLVGSGMPNWTTDEILAVHVRMHQAEGELFRDALIAGVRACGMEPVTLPDKTALDSAAKRLGMARAQLDTELAILGRAAGPPWGKYQKEAAAAALVVLTRPEVSQ